MSTFETQPGQTQTRPEVEGRQDVRDKDAELDKLSKRKHRQVVVGFHRPICLRLITLRMINVCKEIGMMLLIAFTYAALTNDPPKVAKSPPAYPFFPKGSVVKDYYRGELSKGVEQARQSDIAFIMFYAPWDSESQEVRREFELAARHMQKLVSFNAVNCWQPNGECRNHYNKVYNWPVFIAYSAHGRGVQYNGPKTALHMIRFLNSFMAPLVRVNNIELQHLRQTHDAVIVANVDSQPGSLDYAIIYTTAVRYLEKDPFQDVIFAINTNNNNGAYKLSLCTWNNTVMYIGADWKVDALINWIQKKVLQITIWASPTGAKSQQLSNLMRSGPALILFTPRNPLYDSIDYYDMLHEVGLQYFYCGNNTNNFMAYLLSVGIHYHRLDYYKKIKSLCTTPTSIEEFEDNIKQDFSNAITYLNKNKWTNNSYCVSPMNEKDTCINNEISEIIEANLAPEKNLKYKDKFEEMYRNMWKRNVENKKRKDTTWVEADYMLESYKNVYKTSMLTGLNDARSPKNLRKILRQNKCRLKTIAEKYNPPVFSESIINGENWIVDLTGLACQVNNSLSIIAMDSLQYHHFANRLGIDILNRKHKTALVIIDEKTESHYVLDGAVTDNSMRKFIWNFSRDHLKRALITSSNKYNYTHTYNANNNRNQKENSVQVLELDSATFLPIVMLKNKAVIVLYYSKQCSFCNGISYSFLTTSKAFSTVTNILFTRIDGEQNTLPWEYTMESYPTILFVPDVTKSESRIFPRTTALTVTNLVHFILSNLSPSLKLHAMWSLCKRIKFKEEIESCTSKVRMETLALIEKSLKEWRSSDLRDKAVILDKLRELKHLHLLLAHSSIDNVSIQKCLKRLQWRLSTPLSEHKKNDKKTNRSI